MLGNHAEKRDFYRMNTVSPITYKIVGEPQLHEAKCLNLSAGGILITTDRAITESTQLEVTITPQKSIVQPLHAIVEVVRVDADADNGSYAVAGTIREILQ